ncbi:hypothetical protein CYMTET_47891 [Cymbomonas tetramitiformis]|uniref:Uncharacterized protein n=1 Tax=Cymbomonas tetramitiformis TaxID=36881 RepID=A0AAE0BTC0_9CHLO|nr:hypothetical protein CYMTET_47891 [Cymbomonas tetramitiformis]|eukprot:gene32183-40722_t
MASTTVDDLPASYLEDVTRTGMHNITGIRRKNKHDSGDPLPKLTDDLLQDLLNRNAQILIMRPWPWLGDYLALKSDLEGAAHKAFEQILKDPRKDREARRRHRSAQ